VLELGLVLLLASGPAPTVTVGLERVERQAGRPLAGKRVGLIVHAASVTTDGRHAVDVLRGQGIDVRRLFTPEHGLRSRAAAGEPVRDARDPRSGLPIVSLYGGKTRPDQDDLEGLDVLVYDLQDAGVRFYTYVSTLILALEAAAEAGLSVVVLDRPNPLGGERVEGPVSAPREEIPRSLLNTAPGPLVHGLTSGEMARWVNADLRRPARLTVVRMQGWQRRMVWSDTGRPWVAPSPNLRSAEAALAYPGVCLLEATNLSEGRGTPSPFLLFGAPWLKASELAARVEAPGFLLEPTRFTARGSTAAPDPKFDGERCQGLRVRVSDPHEASPYGLGVRLLVALRALQPQFAWRHPQALDRLVGTRRLREALERGDSVERILAADAEDIVAFRRARPAVLLY